MLYQWVIFHSYVSLPEGNMLSYDEYGDRMNLESSALRTVEYSGVPQGKNALG